MSIFSLCNMTADFERKSVTPDTLGLGHTETFAAAYSGVRVALQPANGREIEEFAREGFQVTHIVYMGDVLVIRAGDRMVVDGVYYIIKGPQRDMGGRHRAYSIPVLLKDA